MLKANGITSNESIMLVIMMVLSLVLVSFCNASFAANQTFAQIQNNQAWSFSQPLNIDPLNISGVLLTEGFMVLATDEGNQIELFTLNNQNQWQSINIISLSQAEEEIDFEALAWQKPYLYVLGSHSAKRKKLKNDLSQKDNIKRLQETYDEPARQKLIRIQLNKEGNHQDIQTLTLQNELAKYKLLTPFIGVPSKENGIDLEGLAVDEKGRLLIGFRGPVLRENIVPVLRLNLEKETFAIKKSKLLYLTLQGNGIRGLSEFENQFLVLNGAVGDQNLPYQVGIWNGENALKGKDNSSKNWQYLCDIPVGKQGKPEGIQFIAKQEKTIEFLIVQDGLSNGKPTTFKCNY